MVSDNMLHCQIITPEASVLDERVSAVVLTAHDGEIGILPGRAPLLCKLGIGELRLTRAQGTSRFFVDGGFAHVLGNEVVVLTQQAVASGDIDRGQAETDLAGLLRQKPTDPEAVHRRAEEIKRARMRIKVAATGAPHA